MYVGKGCDRPSSPPSSPIFSSSEVEEPTPEPAPAPTTFESQSKLRSTSVAQVLDALLMRDAEWMWIEDEWRRAGKHDELARRLAGHRALLADEMGKLLTDMVQEPGPVPGAPLSASDKARADVLRRV